METTSAGESDVTMIVSSTAESRGVIVSDASLSERRQQLISLTHEFVDAFNRDDLDAVMAFFSDHAVYDEFHGPRHEGKEAIRKAFEPQFAGAFGVMRFMDEDLFADPEAGKVMTSWRVTMDGDGEHSSFRGLDLLHFDGDRLVAKITYSKAQAPLLE
jgi:ketosteroid isomerase-like protein